MVARRQHDRLQLPGGRGERRHLRRACRRHGFRQAHDRCGTRLRCRMEAGWLAARVRYHPLRYGRNRPHVCRRQRRHADWRRARWIRAGLVGRRIAARVRGIHRGLRLLRLLHVPGDLRGAGGRRQRQSGHVRERGSQPGVEATPMSRQPAAAWPTVCAVALLGGAAACHDAIVGSGPPPPSLSAVAVDANPLNALSIVGAVPPGYLVTEVSHDSAAFVLAFDPEGRMRWYQRIPIHPDESAMETKQLPNGDFTVYVGASTGWQPVGGRYIEFRPDGTIVRVYTAGAPYYTDNHELVVTMTGDGVTAAH